MDTHNSRRRETSGYVAPVSRNSSPTTQLGEAPMRPPTFVLFTSDDGTENYVNMGDGPISGVRFYSEVQVAIYYSNGKIASFTAQAAEVLGLRAHIRNRSMIAEYANRPSLPAGPVNIRGQRQQNTNTYGDNSSLY